MAKFSDISQYTHWGNYTVTVGWDYLPHHYLHYVLDLGLNVSPDFQRGYVWTLEQKVRYVEYILRGGKSGRDIYINAPAWNNLRDIERDHVLVDGKQRLDAVLGFLNNEFPVFGGNYRRDYTDSLRIHQSFNWHVNDLQTREEVLQWYCDLNSGGTVHDPSEIERVRGLIGQPYVSPTQEEILLEANLGRGILQAVIADKQEKAAKEEADRKAREEEEARNPPRKGRKGRKKP